MYDHMLENIYSTFQDLNTNLEKVQYLQSLQAENLHYNINWDNLISYYENAK